MDRRFSPPYLIALLSAPVAAGLRLWSLAVAVDAQGLPAMHGSIWCLIAAAAVFFAAAAVCSLRSPGRSGLRQAICYGRGGYLCAVGGAVLILLSAAGDFSEELSAGPSITTVPLFLLGLAGGLGLIVAAGARRSPDRRAAPAELLPVIYILVRLIIRFKRWSTDPIILDYCVALFALIFTLLAFLLGAGFCLDQGKPRRTLLCAMGAVFLCGAAMMDGIATLSLGTVTFYAGSLLWQLPVIWDLCIPAEAAQPPEADSQ